MAQYLSGSKRPVWHSTCLGHNIQYGTVPVWVITSSKAQFNCLGQNIHSMGPPTVQTNCCSSAQRSTGVACYIPKRHLTQPCIKYFPLIHHSLIVSNWSSQALQSTHVCVCKAKVTRASTHTHTHTHLGDLSLNKSIFSSFVLWWLFFYFLSCLKFCICIISFLHLNDSCKVNLHDLQNCTT